MYAKGLELKLTKVECQRDELAAITRALMRFAVAPVVDDYNMREAWLAAYKQFDETWHKANDALIALPQEKA